MPYTIPALEGEFDVIQFRSTTEYLIVSRSGGREIHINQHLEALGNRRRFPLLAPFDILVKALVICDLSLHHQISSHVTTKQAVQPIDNYAVELFAALPQHVLSPLDRLVPIIQVDAAQRAGDADYTGDKGRDQSHGAIRHSHVLVASSGVHRAWRLRPASLHFACASTSPSSFGSGAPIGS